MTEFIKPIETVYRGHRFRSRLEARWAVFFDAASIEWQYEPDGYRLNQRAYLPDFWLPKLERFVEIKPTKELATEVIPLMRELVDRTDKLGLIIGGAPHTEDRHVLYKVDKNPDGGSCSIATNWYQCNFCNSVGLDFRCDCSQAVRLSYSHDSPRVNHALEQAQYARFEHGENGKPRAYEENHEDVVVYVAGPVIEDVAVEMGDGDGEYLQPTVIKWRHDIFGKGDIFNRYVNASGQAFCRDGRFHYGGPTITEDHGEAREGLASDCIKEVIDSDAMFVWIDRADTVGTLAEIGAAYVYKKPIFIAFANEDLAQHFYFIKDLAKISVCAPDAVTAWQYFKNWQNR